MDGFNLLLVKIIYGLLSVASEACHLFKGVFKAVTTRVQSFLPLVYNCKYVHMYIIALTSKVVFDEVIGHTHRHASCVYEL